MRDITSAFLSTVEWILIAWVVGSAIHFFYPDVLVYFAPIAVFWVIAVGIHAYAVDEEDDSMALSAEELEQ